MARKLTLDDIRALDRLYITPEEAGAVTDTNPQSIRIMARTNPAALGFPVICSSPHRVQIPRLAFLRFMEGGDG